VPPGGYLAPRAILAKLCLENQHQLGSEILVRKHPKRGILVDPV
jgi:hypothetical protein